ncbi:MAG: PQQ-binding-like beta-propeller repeat protein, partial [Pseudomonadales bacterium]|nr:PQQ-binding-like beta-propeller repeat protein [Pseudomonadales bacterium]
MSRALCFLTLVLATTEAHSADWPMWRYDFERTAESPQQLPDHLDLLWHRDLPSPQPAFNDIRLQFDRGYEPVVMGSRLFLASNSEDKVSAFDTNSGELLWQFFCNGPVRLAPAAWNSRVFFGSDDGNFYCVAADTGKLAWKFKAVPSERKLIGNKRLISVWPIRGGPVLKDGRIYFAAGVWPFEGVFIY